MKGLEVVLSRIFRPPTMHWLTQLKRIPKSWLCCHFTHNMLTRISAVATTDRLEPCCMLFFSGLLVEVDALLPTSTFSSKLVHSSEPLITTTCTDPIGNPFCYTSTWRDGALIGLWLSKFVAKTYIKDVSYAWSSQESSVGPWLTMQNSGQNHLIPPEGFDMEDALTWIYDWEETYRLKEHKKSLIGLCI